MMSARMPKTARHLTPTGCWDLFIGAPAHDGSGFLAIGDAPGLGIALRHGAIARFPYRPRKPALRLHVDGSVVDQ